MALAISDEIITGMTPVAQIIIAVICLVVFIWINGKVDNFMHKDVKK
jgi:hypothetical protein